MTSGREVRLDQDELLDLLTRIRSNIADGLETQGMLEPEWSIADRKLVGEIDRVIVGLKRLGEEFAAKTAAALQAEAAP